MSQQTKVQTATAGKQKRKRAQKRKAQAPPANQPKAKRQKRDPRVTKMLAARQSASTRPRSRKQCVLEEDEYIMDVDGSTNFANLQLPINPGQAQTFPWMAKSAPQWEKYRFERLDFYYKRQVSEFAPNGTTGKVILSVDFDASDPGPTTKQQMEDTDPHADCMPCENISLPLKARDMHALHPELFVRTGGLPGSSDIKTFDVGNFNIATSGCVSNGVIGELRVKYRCVFTVPILEATGLVAPTNNNVAMYSQSTAQPILSGANNNIGFTTTVANGIGAQNSAGDIILPAGNYLVDFSAVAQCTAEEITSYTLTLEVNSVAVLVEEYTGPAVNFAELSGLWFVQAAQNGTVNVAASVTFSSGTTGLLGQLRLVLI
jgi:hypothetical protein